MSRLRQDPKHTGFAESWDLRIDLLFAHWRQIRAAPVRHLRRHADAFAQRGVRMDCLADIDRVGAHLDGQRHLADHVAGVGANHAAVKNFPVAVRIGVVIKQQLGKAMSQALAIARPEAVQGNRPFLTLMPCALAWSSVRPAQATSGGGVGDALSPRSLSMLTLGAPKSIPSAAMWLTSSITAATCSSAFDGMQPTFRQAPQRSITLDQHHLQTQISCAEGSRVAAGSGAQHH